MASFKDKLSENTSYIEDIIYGFIPKNPQFQKKIFDAMDYAVKVGGKRLRPMLILETYRFLNGSKENEHIVSPFMAAIEFIHTYSLVHDDLPCMDDATLRRGKSCTHIVFGEDFGVLCGDALLNYAYEVVADAASKCDDLSEIKRIIKAQDILAKKAGIYGMVGGQCVDVENEGKPLSAEMLNFIYNLKTGALLEASMMIGAALAGASDEVIGSICKVAGLVGMAFQIQDDILDVTSNADTLGKNTGIDAVNNKITYVTLYGLEASRNKVKELSDEAVNVLNSLRPEEHFLKELIASLVGRDK